MDATPVLRTLSSVLVALGLLCFLANPIVVLWYFTGKRPGGAVSMLNWCGILTFVGSLAFLAASLLRQAMGEQ